MTVWRVGVLARSVYPLHGVGGLERHVYDLVRYLARAGAEVTLITRPSRMPDAAIPGVDIRTVPYRTFPLAGRKGTTVLDRSTAYPLFGSRAGRLAFQLVQQRQLDIVHGLGASALGYARRRDRAGAPLVINPQGMEEFGATDPARARLKRAAYLPLRRAVLACARAADCVIATDRALEPAVRQHLHVPAARIRIIPNALDLHAIDPLASGVDGVRVRRAAGIGDAEVILLSVGRIEHNKGLHVLVQALAALRDHSGPIAEAGWRWVLVGDGPYRSRLERDIADRTLQRHVVITGQVSEPDLHAWYEAATLFVHPTLYEGSSLVTLEAMAHRRAVVATNAGGLPDKVRTGVNGWLVPPGDVSGLAAALSGALSDMTRLAGLGIAGRAIVEREFSWEAAGAATLRLYEELLSRGSSCRPL